MFTPESWKLYEQNMIKAEHASAGLPLYIALNIFAKHTVFRQHVTLLSPGIYNDIWTFPRTNNVP